MNYTGRIAHIDLDTRCIDYENIGGDLIRKWGGSSGIASWRLFHKVGPRTDALDPANEVWVIAGPLTGTRAPCSGRIEIVTKSPLTGILGLSSTGGHFGARLKHAGLDGLVLHGAAKAPVYLLIRPGVIEFRDALHLWGKETWKTEERIGSELDDPGLNRVKVMSIGPAGENRVRFACLINERYHAAGRGGAGAVFGAKNVKAIVVDSTTPPAAPSDRFRAAALRATRKIRDNPMCQKYTRTGSLPAANAALEGGFLPGHNCQTGTLPRWKETRGFERAMSFVTGPEGSCYHCAMPCFNRVEVPEGPYRGLKIASGTFVRPVLEFGAKCGIESLPGIWKCKELCHRLGLDFCSAAGAVAFALELFQRGLLTNRDTDGMTLHWGDDQEIIKLIAKMAHREGIGNLLAEGTLRMSRVLGPATIPYVLTVKGMEMIGDDARVEARARSLGALTSPRGGDNIRGTHSRGESIPSHLLRKPESLAESEAYSASFVSSLDMFPQEKEAIYGIPPRVDPDTYRGKAILAKWFEDLFAGVNALGLCIFPADKLALGPTSYADLISSFLEEEISPEEFMKMGERIFNIQRLYLVREGMGRKDDTYPERFYKEKMPEGPSAGAGLSRETIGRVLDEYYDARGWDRETGIPTPQTLDRLGIEEKGSGEF
jgi:aldehyde:ferredoxin oxidoreductase